VNQYLKESGIRACLSTPILLLSCLLSQILKSNTFLAKVDILMKPTPWCAQGVWGVKIENLKMQIHLILQVTLNEIRVLVMKCMIM